ncbi:MAG TPA: ATP-binding cassette domain-containing protein [bacterium]|nr:ATP-binding cassette domain-containing protein [bacterium]
MLEIAGLSRTFGGLRAVDEVSLDVREGEIVGLIGPNGAGKTTLFNLVTGFLAPTAGRVRFRGCDITRRSPDGVTAAGIARTFQNIRLFREMPAVENVVVGRHIRTAATLADAVFATPRYRAEERETRARAMDLLGLVGLADRAAVSARSLAYGDQRRLEIARALATEPRLLLLDEPAAGMNTAETQALMTLIRRLREEHGLTVLLIEHDMKLVMGVCDRIVVLNFGRKIAEGAPAEVRRDPAVIEAYLGTQTERLREVRTASSGASVLSVENLSAGYAAGDVLHGVSLDVGAGQIVTLIGANGAGKTTLLRTISGLVRPRTGTIRLRGVTVDGARPDRIVGLGVAHVPEGRQVLARMTVVDNLRAGAFARRDGAVERDLAALLARFPELGERRTQIAGTLSGGEQQMLAIARGLMARPRLLMLDEPSLGLAPRIVERIFAIIREVNGEGTPILLVEQNAQLALETADWGYVLETGRIVRHDRADRLLGDEAVRRAYLG